MMDIKKLGHDDEEKVLFIDFEISLLISRKIIKSHHSNPIDQDLLLIGLN
jgi:hypothetical protein